VNGEAQRGGNVVIALVAALVAALAVGGWLLVDRNDKAEELRDAKAQVRDLRANDDAAAEQQAGQDALRAAREVLLEITTYSWKAGEHEFAWVGKLNNEELKRKLAPNVGDLQKAIRQGKVTAQGEVIDAAARVVGTSQVEVVAFVDQAITDEASRDVRIEEQRVSMTMTLVDDAWLVDRLELLSGTNNAITP
jgi:Mce-associated membrane protein